MDPRRWEEIQASFDEIVELDVSVRGERLATLTSTDPELRRALEALLLADAQASARLAPLEAGILSQLGPAIDPLGLAGRTISHFEVRELLGAGGMGAVYRAEDTRLGRAVALKFLLPPYNLDAAAKTRFLREAHSAAALDHPNLCSIHEVGTSDDGRLFLAMTLYRGETLKSRLALNGPLPVSQALDIARQVAQGLEGAHAAGIVHRDLKPANVMLLPDGTVKILDFGLAKVRDQSLSETGARFGTVSYMAPEQIRGEKVDVRADLWALGVVLYEMITGRKPFGGEEEIAIAHAILHLPPVLPSTHRAEVPASVEDLVLRLLHRDPAGRVASAAELLGDIARLGRQQGARHAVRQRLRKVSRALSAKRRRMLAVGLGGALMIGAVGYTAVTRNGAASAGAVERNVIAVLPFRNLSPADSSAYLADALQDEILAQLHKVPALKPINRNSVMSYGGANTPPLREIAKELRAGAIVEGSVQVVGNRVRVNVQLMDPLRDAPLWVERYDRTLDDIFAIQSEIARQIVATVGVALSGGERDALAQVPTNKAQAYLLYLEGKEFERRPGTQQSNLDSAMASYELALALDPDFALARAAVSIEHGNMYWLRFDMTPARLARQRAEAEAALRLAPDLSQAHQAMAGVHNVGPDTDVRKGLKELRIALRGAPNDARLWRGVAAAYRRLGNWDQFEVAFERAVELDPRDVRLLQDYGGLTHERIGRYAEAIRWYDRAVSVHPDALPFAIDKSWAYASWQGQMDTLRAVMSGPAGKLVLRNGWIRYHARFFLAERQGDSLLKLLKWADEKAPRVRVISTALTFTPKALFAAWAHEMRGDPAAARSAFDSALAIIDSAIMKFPDDWPVHHARGLALAGLGRRAEALVEVGKLRNSFIYRKDLFLRPYVVIGAAQILARAGHVDAALDDLEGLLADRAPAISIHELRLMPIWDPMREHPRFLALLAKYRR